MALDNFGATPALRCGHCGNIAPLEIRACDSRIITNEEDQSTGPYKFTWDAGEVFEIARCPACAQTLLLKYVYHEYLTPEGVEYQVLYPVDRGMPLGLPDSISKAYDAAQRVKNIEANAFGVLLRRVMEIICIDRGAQGRNLNQQLQDLATRGEIPAKLVDVANGIRNLGNVGAHAGVGELTSAEVSILDDLTRAILEYVYSAPLLAEKAEERLRALKTRRTGANEEGVE